MRSKGQLYNLVCVDRADGKCECLMCRFHMKRKCGNSIGHTLPNTTKWVHLEAVTRDGSKNNQDLNNLIALCQHCLTEHRRQLKTQQPQEGTPEGLFDMLPTSNAQETPLA